MDDVLNAEHGIETDLFNRLENDFPKLYNKLMSCREVDTEALFQFLAMLRSRSPAFREAFEIGLAEMVKREIRALPKPFRQPPPRLPDSLLENAIVSIDPHRSLTAMAFYLKTYLSAVTSSCFVVARAPKGCEFVTSDNPVVWFERKRPFGEEIIYSNIPTSRTRVAMPLNKEHILVGRLKRGVEADFRPGVVELSRREVSELNAMQVACSWDEVIGRISIHKKQRDRYLKLAPHLLIDHFDPATNSFSLYETTLRPFKEKHKYQ
jgi:hypothetical protein